MKPQFSKQFFSDNRRKLKEILSVQGPAVVGANGLMQKSFDGAYPFRQESNFWYLSGINEPGVVLVMDVRGDYLILPKISQYIKTFDGEPDTSDMQKTSGIEKIYSHEKGWARLAKRLRTVKQVAGLEPPPSFIEEMNLYTNPARARLKNMVLEQNPRLKFIDIKDKLARLRAIKSEPEITAIRRATDVTMEAFKALSDNVRRARNEYELAAIATAEIMRRGGQHAYEPIIASGPNATVLHYIALERSYKKNELILIDMGAAVHGYASDISRTIGLKPTKRQLEIHSAVQETNKFALTLVKPGVKMLDIEKQTRKFIGQKLIELRLAKSANKQSIKRYYPHATIHCVGLDVHDPPPENGVLQPGMILTIEPGIYVHEESIGVRVEDIVLITEQGCENLSANLSRGPRTLRIDGSD